MALGDKESYWLGFEVAGDTDYAFHPGHLGTTGVITSPPHEERDNSQSALNLSKEMFLVQDRPLWRHRSNVTICAPQLLHFDRNGKPLWFNGWILVDKFALVNQTLLDFQGYMLEPTRLREPEAWQIGDHNMACLTNDQSGEYTNTEKRILEETIETAFEIGSYKPGAPPPLQVNFY